MIWGKKRGLQVGLKWRSWLYLDSTLKLAFSGLKHLQLARPFVRCTWHWVLTCNSELCTFTGPNRFRRSAKNENKLSRRTMSSQESSEKYIQVGYYYVIGIRLHEVMERRKDVTEVSRKVRGCCYWKLLTLRRMSRELGQLIQVIFQKMKRDRGKQHS